MSREVCEFLSNQSVLFPNVRVDGMGVLGGSAVGAVVGELAGAVKDGASLVGTMAAGCST